MLKIQSSKRNPVLVMAAILATLVMAGALFAWPLAAQQGDPPAKPANLTGTVAHDSVTLTWDDPNDQSITGYQILRLRRDLDDLGNFHVHEDNTGSSDTTFTDTDVIAGKRYVYRIKARNQNGLSPRSNFFNGDLPAAPAVPAEPTGLTSSNTYTAITLSWDDPQDDSITGYQVLRRDRGNANNEFEVLVDDTESTGVSYDDRQIAPKGEYEYQVKAWNQQGLSAASAAHSVDVPQDPDSVTAGAIDLGDLTAVTEARSPAYEINGYGDQLDYYKFTLTEPREVSLSLTELDQDADLLLMKDSTSLTLLGESRTDGTDNEDITQTLLEGSYLVLVTAEEEGENSYLLRHSTTDPDADRVEELREEEADNNPITLIEPQSAQAQDDVTLVSNLGESAGVVPVNATSTRSNKFTTGNGVQGYLVSSVTIIWGTTLEGDPDNMVVTIDGDGTNPGSTVVTLTNPSALVGGENIFTADTPVLLEPDTDYFITIANSGSIGAIQRTFSTDQSGELDWEIADSHRRYDGTDWIQDTGSLLFSINGQERTIFELVGNITTTDTVFLLSAGEKVGSTFEVGKHETGYFITEVAISLRNTNIAADRITVTLNESYVENPGRTLRTFSNPSSLVDGENTFTLDTPHLVDPDIRYFLLISASGTLNGVRNREDNGQTADADWATGNRARLYDGSTWSWDTRSVMFSLTGYRNEEDPRLVHNLDRGNSSVKAIPNNGRIATKFTTGDNRGGYQIDRVRIVWDFGNPAIDDNDLRVRIFSANASNEPGTQVEEFINPTPFASSAGTYTFYAPAELTLKRSTNYFLMVEGSGAAIGHLQLTNDDLQDGRAGWTIGDDSLYALEGEDWAAETGSLKFSMQGSELKSTTLVVLNPTELRVTEGVPATYTVVLAQQPPGNASVTITQETDLLTISQETLPFTTQNWDQPQTVTITAEHDDDGDDTPQYIVTHTVSGFADNQDPAILEVKIEDDDERGLIFNPTSLNFQEGQSATYTIRLATKPSGNVTVIINWSNPGLRPTITPDPVVFTTGNWNVPRTVTITTVADSDATDSTKPIDHTPSGINYSGNELARLPTTVTELASAGLIIEPPALTVEQGSQATFTMRLAVYPLADVDVRISSRDSALSITGRGPEFTRDNWDQPQEVTVHAAGDAEPAGANNRLRVDPRSTDSSYDDLTVDDVTVTVTRAPMVELLSATMTVGNETFESSGREYTGYIPTNGFRVNVGAITNDSFTIGWDEYVVQELFAQEVEYSGEIWIFIKLSRDLPQGSILELDGTEFQIGGTKRGSLYEWNQGTPSWSEGQQVQVRVLTPKFNVPVAVEISFGAAEYYAGEYGQTAEVEILLDKDPERVVDLNVAFESQGGARSGHDYSYTNPMLQFEPGETRKTITVRAPTDSDWNEPESERVNIRFHSLPTGVRAGAQDTTDVYLIDQMMYVFLEPRSAWVGESDGQVIVTAVVQTRRHHRPDSTLAEEFRITYFTRPPVTDLKATRDVDYENALSFVEISGPWTWNETCQCSERRIQVSTEIYDDDEAEPVEYFEAQTAATHDRFVNGHGRGAETIRINIIDDDGGGRSLTLEADSLEVVEGDPVAVKIRMDRPFRQSTQVQLKLSGDRDQVFESRETFSFTVSADVMEETLEFPTRQNRLREPAADVTIRLHDPDRSDPEPYSVGEQGSLTFRITDDDPELDTPDGPRDVVATTGNRTMSIAWDPPTNQGGSPVTGYQYRRFYGDGTRDSWVSNGSQTSVPAHGAHQR